MMNIVISDVLPVPPGPSTAWKDSTCARGILVVLEPSKSQTEGRSRAHQAHGLHRLVPAKPPGPLRYKEPSCIDHTPERRTELPGATVGSFEWRLSIVLHGAARPLAIARRRAATTLASTVCVTAARGRGFLRQLLPFVATSSSQRSAWN